MTTPWHPLPAVTPANVLIVEDHPLAADAWRLLFEATGYHVRIAATAATAVTACAERSVDLMVLDLTLPDGSGLDVLAAASAAGTAPRVTVALTGHDDRAVAEQCRRAGCIAVLVKPIAPRELLARAAEWLR
jgi:two-component system, NtrC family, response regulator PilR